MGIGQVPLLISYIIIRKRFIYLLRLRSPSLQFGHVQATLLRRVLTGCPFASVVTLEPDWIPLELATALELPSSLLTRAVPANATPPWPTLPIWLLMIGVAVDIPPGIAVAVATCIGWIAGAVATWTTCHLLGSFGSCWNACCKAGCAAEGRDICWPGVWRTCAPCGREVLFIVNCGVAVFNIWTVPRPGIWTVDTPPGNVGGEVMVVPGWTTLPWGTLAFAFGI